MKKKKRIPKAEFQRKRQVKITEKSKPDKHYHGVGVNIKGREYYESYDPVDPLMYAMAISTAMKMKQYNKMWGPVRRK
jgi:hypothetical protein